MVEPIRIPLPLVGSDEGIAKTMALLMSRDQMLMLTVYLGNTFSLEESMPPLMPGRKREPVGRLPGYGVEHERWLREREWGER